MFWIHILKFTHSAIARISNKLHFQALNRKNQSDAAAAAAEDGDYCNTETWTVRELFARRPDLDAVIDLTNTKRYYDPGDMRRAAPRPEEFEHFKILTKGHEVPNRDVVRR